MLKKKLFQLLVLMAACLSLRSQDLPPKKYFPFPGKIKYDGACLYIEGKETFIYSAAFHYFRTPKALWRDRFAKIKAAGFNTVETYVPWNLCELNMPKGLDDYSQFNFTDLADWLHMAQDEFGLYTVLRPGAFICAEFAGGGYPRWLARFRPADVNGFWLRSADKRYLDWHDHWYKAFCRIIKTEQITTRAPGKKGVILVQIENEYNAHKTGNKAYALQRMYQCMHGAGITVPIFTCLTSECRGSKDAVLSQVFDCDNYYVGLRDAVSCTRRMENLKQQQPDAPGFVTELQGGWFSTVGGTLSEDHYSNDRHFYALAMMSIAGGATGIFPYVFVGGTHFAGWGARGQTTTYDYNAAVRENGALSAKYYAAQNVGDFIKQYGAQLIHSKGGVCAFDNASDEIVGGLRIAADGTRFVFIHNNSPQHSHTGAAQVKPGKNTTIQPMYNIDQDGNKVLIGGQHTADTAMSSLTAFPINYDLAPMETKVLIIPPHGNPETGKWWFFQAPATKSQPQLSFRFKDVKKYNEGAEGVWHPLPEGISLPEMGINDARYVRYRTKFDLDAAEAGKYSRMLFNTFSRDIISIEVNGKIAPRIYPGEKWASEVTRERDKSFTFLKDTEYDNRFDLTGLLKKGHNEVWLVYENIGHEHGYFPMEELCGIRAAGLAVSDSLINKKLKWEYADNLDGVQQGFTVAAFHPENWTSVRLDTVYNIPRKGNHIQPKGTQDALFTWYQSEFILPENAEKHTWRLLINASGNGYIYVNGHNIGRHWELGPQREYYIPECWLNFKKGQKNNIVLGLRQTVNGATIRAMEVRSYDNEGI
ncbi:hypothetical protein BEL04_12360 [Mucilaginibacter sp. PPCGB 2223]|uniref:beta-galactosidase n=1 Tax=Mucilaginibacter sp. PPCGB 2223 TaxID=1886027 RepID=UPI0008260FAB|nr:beta-galactosidase [Mucilaginibacter sp. PPCGB 2223]OCX52263.1 hypothetical protein BEL04_12360 [Mucilaginibacter sp. PPCGB 2223]